MKIGDSSRSKARCAMPSLGVVQSIRHEKTGAKLNVVISLGDCPVARSKAEPTSTATRRGNAKNSPTRRADPLVQQQILEIAGKVADHGGVRRKVRALDRKIREDRMSRARRRAPALETDCLAGHIGLRTGESVRELPDWICVTTSTRAGARVGGDPSRASCVIRVCSSREDFGRRLFNKKSGRHREHRVASGRVCVL